jgi:glycosyltransferase involved in cell wall biosynthesis
MRKKVAIIGTAGVPGRYGGFETLVHHLTGKLGQEFDLHIYCSTHFYAKEERVRQWRGATLHYIPFNANGIQSIPYDILSILHALRYAQSLVILGVSGGILIPFIKWFSRKNIVVNIDGLEWKRAKWSKPIRIFLKLSEFLAVQFSDADITDNAAIKEYTAVNYGTLSHLIAYGGDHVMKVKPHQEDEKVYPFLKWAYAFKVCRIEPENNVHTILEAFSRLPDWPLVFVGNWAKSDYGIQLREQYGRYSNLVLLDPIYDQEQLDLLRSNCALYIHGHSAGGTNPSLVEAMNLGLPVVAFTVSYNMATTENQARYFASANELVEIISELTREELARYGATMLEIARRRYTWDKVAQQYGSLIMGFEYAYEKSEVRPVVSKLSEEELQNTGMAHLKTSKLFFE